MQAEITFFGNTPGTKAAEGIKIFQIIKPIQEFRQFIEKSDWEERLLGCEKYLNRFSWGIISAAVVFLTPVCINIFTR